MSIVWCPLPLLSWFVPFIGHLGIVTSEGVIHDFIGPYAVNRNAKFMGFGSPTRFYQVKLSDLRALNGPSPLRQWDEVIEESSTHFEKTIHNLFCNNCHHHVGSALNKLEFMGRRDWATVSLMWFMFSNGHFVSTGKLLRTWLPFVVIAIILIVISLSVVFGSKA